MDAGEIRFVSEGTKIQWATHTFNPWEGCTKVSPGCANCYAEARNHRFGMDNWGKGKPRRRTSAATWRGPVKWNAVASREQQSFECNPKQARFDGKEPVRPKVFPSLCDWLDDEVPIEWLADFLKLIHETPHLNWLLLTKRPENFGERVLAALNWNEENREEDESVPVDLTLWLSNWIGAHVPPENMWIGVSVENQKTADQRIQELLKIPARVRFLSVEPMLERIDFSKWIGYYPIHEDESSDGKQSDGSDQKREHGSGFGGKNLVSKEKGMEQVAEDGSGSPLQTETSGTKHGWRIPSGEGDDRRNKGERMCAPNSVSSVERRDSSRVDDQSQRRAKGQQSSGQLRTGLLFGTDQACQNRSWEKIQDSGRGKERHGETHGSRSEGDNTSEESGGESQIGCRIVRDNRQECVSNSIRPSLEIHQMIFGGESGPNARPCNVAWIRDGVRQCRAAGIAPFVKQLGSFSVEERGSQRVRLLWEDKKGGDMAEWSEDLRIREFPRLCP